MPRRALIALMLLLTAAPSSAAARPKARPAPRAKRLAPAAEHQAPRTAHRVRRTAAQSQALMHNILDNVATQIWDHGDYYWHEGRYEDQAALCMLLTRLDPGFGEAYSSGGWLYENLGRKDEALAVYRAAVLAIPNDWRPWHDLGYFYFQEKRYREAADTLEKAVKLKPEPFVWHIYAHAHEKLGDRERSIAIWQECIALHPNDGAAKHNLRRLTERNAPAPPDEAN
jgi:tetratricopeptide (TPR) repeat protein